MQDSLPTQKTITNHDSLSIGEVRAENIATEYNRGL